MKNYGRTNVSEFLGDRIVYRNLVPCDNHLPNLKDIRSRLGIAPGMIPRKSEADYARVIVHLLKTARRQEFPTAEIRRLAFVGDTRLLDGTAFANICQESGWPGMAFIGAETAEPAAVKTVANEAGQTLYLSNRWTALTDFDRFYAQNASPIDENTAIIIDLDKTALGGRGRNGQVIDRARVEAVRNTVAGLLGSAFDPQAFRLAYQPLNEPEFHPFTADNQDYLAYVCLILGSGLYDLPGLVADIKSGRLASFSQFIKEVDCRKGELPAELAKIHTEIYANVQSGDPTPFKPFRRNEYLTTIRCFGSLGDGEAVEKLLQEEILITQEVRAMALEWQSRGALLFGLSDKPDEAAIPTEELASQGYLPLHRAKTHAVGE